MAVATIRIENVPAVREVLDLVGALLVAINEHGAPSPVCDAADVLIAKIESLGDRPDS